MRHFVKIFLVVLLLNNITTVKSQALHSVAMTSNKGLSIKGFNGWQKTAYPLPLVSFLMNDAYTSTLDGEMVDDKCIVGQLEITYQQIPYESGVKLGVSFKNTSNDTLEIANVVPFGESKKHVYITAYGKPSLSRSHLFRPDYQPLNVILPDNAWELGFSTVNVDNGNSIAALARRDAENSHRIRKSRFATFIYPGGELRYNIWMDDYIGVWQEGLKLMFQDRALYDVEPGTFNDNLLKREDQQWIKKSYITHFIHVWYNYFYDYKTGKYSFDDFESEMRALNGGDDCITLWHGFPVLGIDQRNQFDLLRSLPGGIEAIKQLSENALLHENRLMTAYNPWDLPAGHAQLRNSTRRENHIDGLGKSIKEAGMWGLMFDTRSEGNIKLQDGLDHYKKGVVIFPEGMPVVRDMQNSVVGRVHAALKYPPVLNLNKLIRPDFAIFQQTVIEDEDMRRNFSLAFFNGYGVDIHLSVNPEIDWVRDSYKYLGKTVRILRENSQNFLVTGYTPLLPTTIDSVWVNSWSENQKNIYTIYSQRPDGFSGELFEVNPGNNAHFVDLWNHKEIKPVLRDGKWYAPVEIAPFNAAYLNTNNEGQVACIAKMPRLLSMSTKGNNCIDIQATEGTKIKVWQGVPVYGKQPLETIEVTPQENLFKVKYPTGAHIVVQLFDGDELIDERCIEGHRDSEKTPSYYTKSKEIAEYASPAMSVKLLREQDLLEITTKRGDKIKVEAKDDKDVSPITLANGKHSIKLVEKIGVYEGDVIVTLFEQGERIDSCELFIPYRQPRLNSAVKRTPPASEDDLKKMVLVPQGNFRFRAAHVGNWFIKYPVEDTGKVFRIDSFLIDKHPVTNREFKDFMDATNYVPLDNERFLFHWEENNFPEGRVDYPVTYISYEDAKAYAEWAGKRLPTEKEWQYAAQAGDMRLWPWGNEKDSTGTLCNPGNGIMDPVLQYPQGENPWGIQDLTGCIWQLTNDLYRAGTVDYIILKGGTYFDLYASWWYVKGGALPLINRQQLLRVSQGYERSSTIGFRCVKDI